MRDGDPLIYGRYLKQFESDFDQHNGAPDCFAVVSCIIAIDFAIILSGIKEIL